MASTGAELRSQAAGSLIARRTPHCLRITSVLACACILAIRLHGAAVAASGRGVIPSRSDFRLESASVHCRLSLQSYSREGHVHALARSPRFIKFVDGLFVFAFLAAAVAGWSPAHACSPSELARELRRRTARAAKASRVQLHRAIVPASPRRSSWPSS